MTLLLSFCAVAPLARRWHQCKPPASGLLSWEARRRASAVRPPLGLRMSSDAAMSSRPLNVLGEELRCCCLSPRTGFYRDGHCQTGPEDLGVHTVCTVVTEPFLAFSKARGNDLITPVPSFSFSGLKPGDRWCLCASRWKEALDAGVAPKVVLEASHAKSLEFATIKELRAHSVPYVEPAAPK